jgi:hypothetical protein
MPAVTGTANNWRDHGCRGHNNRGTGHDHDCIRPTPSIGSTVKADTASARSIGSVDTDKRK